MGSAIYVKSPDCETEIFSLVGSNKLRSLWMPIVSKRQLHYLNYIFTAGLGIDADNYADILAELEVLCAELENVREEVDDIVNPIFRCKRCLRILHEYDPVENPSVEVYIG